ncbi:MAG: sulfate-transporting ATPase [Ignavibacteria bacterium]|nr:MAG: sulfate-transporting ATPase [Ignavibacteria bacterium]KAF0161611.1 MAG: sulfate-transporting ATPase [Ignavibacteria bacterium]
MKAVELKNIVKTYALKKSSVTAVDDVSFSVEEGEIFGLIGPDGAGKTSIFRILTTLLLADKGNAKVLCNDVVKDWKTIRDIVGYMPGRFSLYQDLTVEENLDFFATIFNTTIQENYDLVADIYKQLEPFKTRRAGKLSGGMKQKLALSCALIHKPKILFLDEPTTGVDPVSRKEFWEILKRLKKQGITILVSTPYMDEAKLCDRIALMQKGKIMTIDTPEAIVNQFGKNLYAVHSESMFKLLNDLRSFTKTESCFAFGENHHLTLKEECTTELEKYLLASGHNNATIKKLEPGIEDCFMQLMKK